MRRTALALVVLLAAFGIAAMGCGSEEEGAPVPDTVTGETDTTETETTETTETTEPAEPGGDPVAGKQVFIANCGTCHVLADAGTSGTIGPNLDDAEPSFDLAVERVTNGQGAMPPFKDQLSEQQIQNVATYVSQTAGD